MKLEDEVQQLIQIYAAKNGCNLMRNNSGALVDKTGRMVRYGLGNISSKHNRHFKSSDLIGITTVTVQPSMVGKVLGVFTAMEVKREGWKFSPNMKHEQAQLNFLKWVICHGGLAGFAPSVDSAIEIIESINV